MSRPLIVTPATSRSLRIRPESAPEPPIMSRPMDVLPIPEARILPRCSDENQGDAVALDQPAALAASHRAADRRDAWGGVTLRCRSSYPVASLGRLPRDRDGPIGARCGISGPGSSSGA